MSRNGVLLAFLAYIAFAISDASIKLIGGRIDTFEIAFLGALMGFSALPFIRRPDERYGDVLRSTVWHLWTLRAVSTGISAASSVLAFTHLPMPEAFSLIFLMPMFVTLLSIVFLKEEVGAWRWTAIVLGFVGVLIVLRPGFRELNVGHLGALVAGLSGAVSVVSFRMAGPQEKRISLFGAGLVGALVLNGVLMLPNWSVPAGADVAFLLAYGLLSVVGQVLIMLAVSYAPASHIAMPQYSQMAWALLFSYLLFHEPVDGVALFGIAVICAAGLLTWARERVKLPRLRRSSVIRPR
jgi:S-adenosylmethionine uptake transporter